MPRRPSQLAAMLLLTLCLTVRLEAHEFWIEPERYHGPVGAPIGLNLYVGQHFSGESIPYLPERFLRFASYGPGGVVAPFRGVLGDEPAATLTPRQAGLYRIALETRADQVRFDSREEFEAYLLKEGLELALTTHRATTAPWRPTVEHYSRHAKALVVVGPTPAAARDQPLGLRLELVAEGPLTQLNTHTPITLRLYYQGQPLAGALVTLTHKGHGQTPVKLRSDRDGRVRTRLPQGGVWLASTVHMLPAAGPGGSDWNSLWASLTFEVH